MSILPKWLKHLYVPDLVLDNNILDSVDCQKYLGCFLSNNLLDNFDINRQIRDTYTRGNILIKKFRTCSEVVKVKLFKTYCTSFYCTYLWSKHHMNFKNKLIVAYKRIFRGLFNYELLFTTYNMIALTIDPFLVLERRFMHSFRNRLFLNDNPIIQCIVDYDFFYTSSMYKTWNNVIFNCDNK